MTARRTFLGRLAQAPLIGGLFGGAAAAKPAARDYFKELGVKPFINAAGTYTTLTASLMPPEVMAAINYASTKYVHLPKLQEAVGSRIAELLGVEAAMVTSGAAGALTVGTAACITGKDPQKILRIPDLTGMKNEVLVQKTHRYGYDHAVRTAGVRMVEIETVEELERAAGEKSAMMLYFHAAEKKGQINSEEWVRLGKKLNIPTFVDAAANVPPVENLGRLNKLGFDLVTFSGGKGLRGPQSAGLLLGRRDLIEAARMNTSPYSDTLARGMKVNKEEMLGMLAAIERYLKLDHKAEWKEWERRVSVIDAAVKKVKSVRTEIVILEIADAVPHLKIRWDQNVVKLNGLEAKKHLSDGEPGIEANPMTNKDELAIGVWMMQPGDAEVVARRVQQVLRGAQI
jgi:L-seryl-tRNA(Ser) seleniumtransferase